MNRIKLMQTLATALLTGALLAPAWAAPSPKAAEVTMGSVAMDIPVEMIKRMSVLTNYLALSTQHNVRFRPSPNMGSAVDDLGKGQTQIAYLTPVAYIEAHKKYGVIPLVAPTTQGRPHFSLVIGVKAGSGITTPAMLKGKRFAFGDEKALLQKAAVESMGLVSTDFSTFAYLKHYDNIAKAVLAGDFEGGILKDSVAEAFKPSGINVIGSTAPLPGYVFAVHPSMPMPLRNSLRDALLALKKTTPDMAATLEAFDAAYDGFVTVDDPAYDPVRKLIQPYQK
ncbi:PhnD/SsuA/transferrin family substrate-binding protein [Thiobacillus sp.]|uniref:PhnD/SsuA/transferrin family substrate-binding protein n=1 Tax=Thiobacillus sp. TaxID=924 RepID=UPI0025E91022|nr:PhnD/SsuA/transferrin family substrate-binding protein [Thiobacillus sp.]MBT9538918.1 PhnD/SsuA/transferrin family substrate-binding protein [Thiobacillus sp.]